MVIWIKRRKSNRDLAFATGNWLLVIGSNPKSVNGYWLLDPIRNWLLVIGSNPKSAIRNPQLKTNPDFTEKRYLKNRLAGNSELLYSVVFCRSKFWVFRST
jgi:hypothetical protein